MTILTRQQARAALTGGGWDTNQLDIMTAVGAAESNLKVDESGPANHDGTHDYGWLQINSRYVTDSPHWDKARLLSDATYTAACAHSLFLTQGLRAWAAYHNGAYLKYLPPTLGGPVLAEGSEAWFLVAELQLKLNAAGADLVADGAFGPKTKAALVSYQSTHLLEPGVVGAYYWKALGL